MVYLPQKSDLHIRDIHPERAATLVLLHDYGLDGTLWDQVIPLIQSPVRILIPDLPGHGHNAPLRGTRPMRDMVYDVADALFSAKSKAAVVVGVGIGGMIAQGLAAEVPSSFRALVLIGTGAKLETEARWLARAETLATSDPQTRARALLDAATLAPTPALRRSAEASHPQTLRHICEAVAHTDLRMSTARLRLPTLGLVGRDDRITPPDLMRELIDTIPGATLDMIPRAGHLTPHDAPQATAGAIDRFLKQTGHLLPDHDAEDPET